MIKIRSKITRFGPTWILFTTRDRYFCITVLAENVTNKATAMLSPSPWAV